MYMEGLHLNRPITFRHASLRFFAEGESHVNRVCEDDVLLLVFDGVLRFTENGVPQTVGAGNYYIQRRGLLQRGDAVSEAPRYLYVHFRGEWSEEAASLAPRGSFSYAKLQRLMEELDSLSHRGAPYVLKAGKFYELLAALYQQRPTESVADRMAAYLERESGRAVSIEELCGAFHFSKNHVINLFKKAFGVTPILYLNRVRLRKARYDMEVTSDPIEEIAARCGFGNYSHFYKLFCRETGTSPHKWRERTRER